MADEKPAEPQEKPQVPKSEAEKPAKKGIGALLPWIILTAVILVCGAGGFGVGRMLGRSSKPAAPDAEPQGEQTVSDQLKPDDPTAKPENVWYFDLDPVVANLDEPGATRYVQATFTLEISGEMDAQKGAMFLTQKKPLMTNWLAIYLASLNLERTRGDKNLQRIQSEVLDVLNEKLFPDAKPLVKRILIKEFAVQ